MLPVPKHPIALSVGMRIVNSAGVETALIKRILQHEKAAQRQSDIIAAAYTREVETPSVDNITLKDAVFILALARHSLREDLGYVEPFNKDKIALAPLYEFQNDIVTHLSTKGFITVCSASPLHAFIFDPAETYIDAHYPAMVRWEFLPGLSDENKCDYLKSLQAIANEDQWSVGWLSDIPKLWHLIAKYECLEFFLHLLAQRGYLTYTIGENTHKTFENLLEDFPVSRIYNLSMDGSQRYYRLYSQRKYIQTAGKKYIHWRYSKESRKNKGRRVGITAFWKRP